jgi:hypothetical protein
MDTSKTAHCGLLLRYDGGCVPSECQDLRGVRDTHNYRNCRFGSCKLDRLIFKGATTPRGMLGDEWNNLTIILFPPTWKPAL